MWKEFDCTCNPFCSCFCNITPVTTIIMRCMSRIPSINCVWGPCTLFRKILFTFWCGSVLRFVQIFNSNNVCTLTYYNKMLCYMACVFFENQVQRLHMFQMRSDLFNMNQCTFTYVLFPTILMTALSVKPV